MRNYRYFTRYRQIVSTLFRHGLGWVVVYFGAESFVPFHWGLLGHPKRKERYSGPEHLRMAFEELGPAYIKLAQILSTRPDLISVPYAEELAKLQKRVPPLPFSQMEAVLKEELGESTEKLFKHFETEPLGSASIGQVYRAVLHDDTKVVVKIQRPDVQEQIDRDLLIMKDAAQRLQRRAGSAYHYDYVGFVEEFSFTLQNELDYTLEGRNADRLREIHADDLRVLIPKVYWDYSSARVLVMDEIEGIPITELNATEALTALERAELAQTATELTFTQIFKHGFFHADPHPGNFVIVDQNVIGLMDYGMVGYLTQPERESFLRFTYEMVEGDIEAMLDALWDLGVTEAFSVRPALKRDLHHLIFRVRESSFQEIAASDLLRGLMSIAYKHGVELPSNLALLFKVLIMDEGLGAAIDPNFKLFEYIKPFLEDQAKKIASPANIARKAEADAVDFLRLVHGLPQRTRRLLQRLETGDLEITARHVGLEKEGERIYAAINRLTVSILFNLFVLAFGLYVISVQMSDSQPWHSTLFFALLAIIAANLIRMLYVIWRQRRP